MLLEVDTFVTCEDGLLKVVVFEVELDDLVTEGDLFPGDDFTELPDLKEVLVDPEEGLTPEVDLLEAIWGLVCDDLSPGLDDGTVMTSGVLLPDLVCDASLLLLLELCDRLVTTCSFFCDNAC